MAAQRIRPRDRAVDQSDTVMEEEIRPQWNPEARFEVVPGADHFYGGHTVQLEEILTSNLEKIGQADDG